jgi:transcriptional regulator with XRE-family HTH domain
MSQERLGQISGLHRNYVGGVERGELNPSFASLLQIARAVDVPLSDLFLVYERLVTESSGAH